MSSSDDVIFSRLFRFGHKNAEVLPCQTASDIVFFSASIDLCAEIKSYLFLAIIVDFAVSFIVKAVAIISV